MRYQLDGVRVQTPPEGQYWIASNAVVLGNVKLHREASVWFGAVLRGDNELIDVGERTNIQDGCILHTDPGFPLKIGEGCTIGHRALLHGCTIGNNCLVGIGATILNGCRVGDNCIIGAHTLLTEGKEIAAGSLVVGSPGRIARSVTSQDIETIIKLGANQYVENWKRYARAFDAIGQL